MAGDFGGGGGPFEDKQEDVDNQKKLDDNIINDIGKLDHVLGVSPVMRLWELQNIRLKDGEGRKYKAEGTEAYEPGVSTEKKMLAGRNFTSDDDKGKVIIGDNMRETLGFKSSEEAVGKKVIFTTKKGYQGDGAEIPAPGSDQKEWDKTQEKTTELEAEIVGITTSPGPGRDSSIFIPMNWGRKIASWSNWKEDPEKVEAFKKERELTSMKSGRGEDKDWDIKDCSDCMILQTESQIDREGYQLLYVKTDNSDNTKGVAEEIKKIGFETITAEDIIAMFTRVAYIIALVLGAIGAISLGVATIGIINTMVMAIMERTREIGVMRACGARKKTVRRLFMFEAASLGFLGGVIGILLGIVISKIANFFINKLLLSQNMAGENVISLPLWLILATIFITTFLGLLSGLYPAHRAARLNPVEALRYE